MKTLIIMQGPPGGGKSSLADKLATRTYHKEWRFRDKKICCTDDYFNTGPNDKFVFDPTKLAENHGYNLAQAKLFMDCEDDVIVDNTNIHAWECREYVKYAVERGYHIVFIRVDGNFPSIHGVPQAKIDQMRREMESLTVESVLASKAPWEREHVVVTYIRHEDFYLVHQSDTDVFRQTNLDGDLSGNYVRQRDGKVFQEWKTQIGNDPYVVELVEQP